MMCGKDGKEGMQINVVRFHANFYHGETNSELQRESLLWHNLNMKIVLMICLMLTAPAMAQRSLSQEAFRANVRPVLSGILNDFYQMITLFPDYPKEIIPLVEEVDRLAENKENLRGHCPRVLNDSCFPDIRQIQDRLGELSRRMMKARAQMKMSSAMYLGNLSGMRVLDEFEAKLENVKGIFDNKSFFIKARITEKKETYPLIRELDEINTLMSLAVVEFIPFTYKEDFRHFYFNFVHPIEINISKNQNYEFLNRNVNSLNFTLNLLNMNLTKRNKKTPEGMGPYLNTIHNRWNSLLRYYF